MTIKHSYKGSNVALITPMFDDGAVDYDALNNLIDFHIDAGTSSIVSCLLYTSPSPRDRTRSRMPSSA